MEKRRFVNPAINDAATFLKTSSETNGEYTLMEIELGKSDGPPLHYHNAFSEKFEVREGVLYLQVGKDKKVLQAGESVTVPAGTNHRFYNEKDDNVKFNITLRPGHLGMENFIKIFYGLAADGLTDEKGKPNSFAHLAVAFCRALNIPARYCAGYLSDVGTPAPYPPGDFAAWFEAYLGGQWHTFDPRNNVPRIGRVLIARGRDAADVAITTTFGPNTLHSFRVWTDEAAQVAATDKRFNPSSDFPPKFANRDDHR